MSYAQNRYRDGDVAGTNDPYVVDCDVIVALDRGHPGGVPRITDDIRSWPVNESGWPMMPSTDPSRIEKIFPGAAFQ